MAVEGTKIVYSTELDTTAVLKGLKEVEENIKEIEDNIGTFEMPDITIDHVIREEIESLNDSILKMNENISIVGTNEAFNKIEEDLSTVTVAIADFKDEIEEIDTSFETLKKEATENLEAINTELKTMETEQYKSEVETIGEAFKEVENKGESSFEGIDGAINESQSEIKGLDSTLEGLESSLKEVENVGVTTFDNIDESIDRFSESAEHMRDGQVFNEIFTGFTESANEVNGQILNMEINMGKLNSTFTESPEDIKATVDEMVQFGSAMFVSKNTTITMLGLISQYTDNLEQLKKGYELASEGAVLYAMKEGDVTQADEQILTSFEAMRDTIMTGSTTFWEDAGLDVEMLNKSLKNQGIVLEETTGRVFEDTETMWKNASVRQRVSVLSDVMGKTIGQSSEALSEEGKQAYDTQMRINDYKTAIQEAKISIIEFITEHGKLVKGMIILSGVIIGLNTAMIAYEAVLAVVALVQGAYNVALGIASIEMGAWTIATWAQNTAMAVLDVLTAPLTLIILALAGAVVAVVIAFNHWSEISDFLAEKLGWLWTDVLEPMVVGLFNLAKTIAGVVLTIVKVVIAGVKAIAEGIKWLWDNFIKPIATFLINWIVIPFVTTMITITKVVIIGVKKIAEGLMWLFNTVIKPVAKVLFNVFVKPFIESVVTVVKVVSKGVQAIAKVLIWLQKNVFGPVEKFLYELFIEPFFNAFKWVQDNIGVWVTNVQTWFTNMWNTVFVPIGDWLNKYLVEPFTKAFDWVSTKIQEFSNYLNEKFVWIQENIFKPVGDAINTYFVEPLTGAIQVVEDAFNGLVTFFTNMWNNITGLFTTGVNTMINLLNKIPFVDIGLVGGESQKVEIEESAINKNIKRAMSINVGQIVPQKRQIDGIGNINNNNSRMMNNNIYVDSDTSARKVALKLEEMARKQNMLRGV